jgi:hypothetical protein
VIEGMGQICESAGIESSLYWRNEDSSVIIVKSIFLKELIGYGLIKNRIA